MLCVRCYKGPTYTEGVLRHQEFSICPSLTQNIEATLEVNQKCANDWFILDKFKKEISLVPLWKSLTCWVKKTA